MLSFPDLATLRTHVKETLCARDRLDPTQAQLRQAAVVRGGKTCGLLFQVNGPRLLKTYAVWAGDESRILFYESTGARFGETTVLDGPDPSEAVKRRAA